MRCMGLFVVFGLLGGLGTWSALAEISGAVIAPGHIAVDTNAKKVQHPEGGVVAELKVREGARVKAGDLLVVLDDTVLRANLAIVSKALDELTAQEARLVAERDGADQVRFPGSLIEQARVQRRRQGFDRRPADHLREPPDGARNRADATVRADRAARIR